MKRFVFLSMAVCMMVLTYASTAEAQNRTLIQKTLRITIYRPTGNPPTPTPHYVPDSNVITDVQAVFNQDTYVLGFKFFSEYGHCSFSIYQDGALIITAGYAAHTGGYKTFDLSAYGPGEYEVVLENGTIRGTGSFTAEDDE